MNKKLLAAGAAGLLLLLAVVLMLNGRKEPKLPAATTASGTTAQSETAAPTAAPTATESMQTTAVPTASAEQTESTMGIVETRAPEAPHTEPPVPVETESPWLQFPVEITEYGLEIQAVRSYDGIYLEDGSDVPISGVAAILVTNHSDQCVDLATLQLTGEKTSYSFKVTGLAAGETVVVMEAGKAPAVEQRYLQAAAEVAQTDRFEMSEGVLAVEDDGDQLRVTNLTDRVIPCARIFYKFYLEEARAYVGGITYTAKLLDLQPGASVLIRPSHYAVGSSRVIMAKTYDTDLE